MSYACGSFVIISIYLFENLWAEKLKQCNEGNTGYFCPSCNIEWNVRALRNQSDSNTSMLCYNLISVVFLSNLSTPQYIFLVVRLVKNSLCLRNPKFHYCAQKSHLWILPRNKLMQFKSTYIISNLFSFPLRSYVSQVFSFLPIFRSVSISATCSTGLCLTYRFHHPKNITWLSLYLYSDVISFTSVMQCRMVDWSVNIELEGMWK
jgi:hypothetical protein